MPAGGIPAFRALGRRVVRCSRTSRADAEAFLALARPSRSAARSGTFSLAEANDALDRLRAGRLTAAAVLVS